jgi:hypothetical protein
VRPIRIRRHPLVLCAKAMVVGHRRRPLDLERKSRGPLRRREDEGRGGVPEDHCGSAELGLAAVANGVEGPRARRWLLRQQPRRGALPLPWRLWGLVVAGSISVAGGPATLSASPFPAVDISGPSPLSLTATTRWCECSDAAATLPICPSLLLDSGRGGHARGEGDAAELPASAGKGIHGLSSRPHMSAPFEVDASVVLRQNDGATEPRGSRCPYGLFRGRDVVQDVGTTKVAKQSISTLCCPIFLIRILANTDANEDGHVAGFSQPSDRERWRLELGKCRLFCKKAPKLSRNQPAVRERPRAPVARRGSHPSGDVCPSSRRIRNEEVAWEEEERGGARDQRLQKRSRWARKWAVTSYFSSMRWARN